MLARCVRAEPHRLTRPVRRSAWSRSSPFRRRQGLSHRVPCPALGHGRGRAPASRRRRPLPAGRRDRRRRGDRLGRARAPVGAAVDPDGRRRPSSTIARSRSSPGAAVSRRSPPPGAGRSPATARLDRGGQHVVHLDRDTGPPASAAASTSTPRRPGKARLDAAHAPGPTGRSLVPWSLRATDVDLMGHVNNAAYWSAVEHCLQAGSPDLQLPVRAPRLPGPLDLGRPVELAASSRRRPPRRVRLGRDGEGCGRPWRNSGRLQVAALDEQRPCREDREPDGEHDEHPTITPLRAATSRRARTATGT